MEEGLGRVAAAEKGGKGVGALLAPRPLHQITHIPPSDHTRALRSQRTQKGCFTTKSRLAAGAPSEPHAPRPCSE